MKKKIENYLLKQEGVSFHKQSDSGSVYYKVGSSKIRIADHMCPAFNDPRVLEIIIPVVGESFVLIIGSKVVVMNNYDKLREYIRAFCLTALCTKPIIVTKEVEVVAKGVELPAAISFEGISEKQIRGFAKMLNDLREQNKNKNK